MNRTKSPRITHLSWGHVEIETEARHQRFKDVKLFPGGAREWDWRETGTRHVPGIQPADVGELLDHGAEVIVLSKGILKRLQVCPETLEVLQGKQIFVHVLQTEEARRLYNKLREEQPVGALLHSTC
jgi:hypothetical protein